MKRKAADPHGRPSIYSDALALQICQRLASGEPLVRICRDDSMPGITTIYRWMAEREPFRQMYARAREDQADTLADEIQAIADEPMTGKKTVTKANGDVETTEGDMLEHRRLRVDARKWIASKLKPRAYADRTTLQNPDGTPLNCVPVINLTVLPPSEQK